MISAPPSRPLPLPSLLSLLQALRRRHRFQPMARILRMVFRRDRHAHGLVLRCMVKRSDGATIGTEVELCPTPPGTLLVSRHFHSFTLIADLPSVYPSYVPGVGSITPKSSSTPPTPTETPPPTTPIPMPSSPPSPSPSLNSCGEVGPFTIGVRVVLLLHLILLLIRLV
jgi:hypothetical protein